MARKNQDRNAKILSSLAAGNTMRATAEKLGISFHVVVSVRRSFAAINTPGLKRRGHNNLHSKRLPWTPADELLDDDEQYGPYRRCRCDAVLMRSDETECGRCLSTAYVFDNFGLSRSDNHAEGNGRTDNPGMVFAG